MLDITNLSNYEKELHRTEQEVRIRNIFLYFLIYESFLVYTSFVECFSSMGVNNVLRGARWLENQLRITEDLE